MLRTAQSLPQEWAFDTGLRPRPFPDEAASLLPGPLAATRTGLTPASDDELTTQDQPPTRSTSCLLGARKGFTAVVMAAASAADLRGAGGSGHLPAAQRGRPLARRRLPCRWCAPPCLPPSPVSGCACHRPGGTADRPRGRPGRRRGPSVPLRRTRTGPIDGRRQWRFRRDQRAVGLAHPRPLPVKSATPHAVREDQRPRPRSSTAPARRRGGW
jgi:hypothetical protein